MVLITWLWRAAYGVAGLASLAVGALYFLQEKLLYVPSAPGIPQNYECFPDQFHLKHEDVHLTTKDGLSLHAWLLWNPAWDKATLKEKPLVLFFQANAGNISHRLPFFREFISKLHCVVLAPSYRGYGPNPGSPTEGGLKLDSEAAIEYVMSRKDLRSEQLVVMGRSLGGAVAIHLAAQHQDKVKAVIVENSFTSIEDMVPQVLPFMSSLIGKGRWCNFLVRNKWLNYVEIKKLQMPLLLLSSSDDEMVPRSQMEALHRITSPANRTFVDLVNAHHMDAYDVCPLIYWPALQRFLDKHVQ